MKIFTNFYLIRLFIWNKFSFININRHIFNIKFIFIFIYILKLKKKIIKKFLLDLYKRFANKGFLSTIHLKSQNRYVKPPIVGNIHLVPWFLKTPNIYTIIGDWNYLQLNLTYSGIEMPYIITYNKKPFWKFYESFIFLKDFWSLFFFKTNLIFTLLKKNNLIKNMNIKVTDMVLRKLLGNKKNYYNYFNLNTNAKYLNLNDYFKSIFSNKLDFSSIFSEYFKKGKEKKLKINKYTNKFINLKYRQRVAIKRYRTNLKYFFFTKNREKHVNKFCLRFKNKLYSNFDFLKYFELRLINVILRVHIVHLLKDARYLIKNGFILVNGVVVYNENYILKLGDKVNIVFSNIFYAFYREHFSSSLTRFYRMWPYIFTRLRNISDMNKTKSLLTPYWITKSLWNEEDVPKYVEVDYITMSFFIVYEPKTILDIFPYYYNNIKLNAIRIYNWRFNY